MKSKPFVQIGPARLTFIPGLSVFARATWESSLNVGFTAAATEKHTFRIFDSTDSDGFVQFGILYEVKRPPLEFTRTASLTGEVGVTLGAKVSLQCLLYGRLGVEFTLEPSSLIGIYSSTM